MHNLLKFSRIDTYDRANRETYSATKQNQLILFTTEYDQVPLVAELAAKNL